MNPVFLFILFLINQALLGGVVNSLCCSGTEELQIFDLIYSMDSAGDLFASLDIQSPDWKDGQVWSISAQMRRQQASDYNLDFLQFFFLLN